MTATRSSMIRRISLTIALLTSIASFATPGHAYTAEQQRLCTGDAFRLCSSEIPSIDRITACMVKQKANLSPGCKSVFGKPEQTASQ